MYTNKPDTILASVIQICPSADVQANLDKAAYWIAAAADQGAELIALQETFHYSGPHTPEAMQAVSESLPGPISNWLAEQAREQGVWLIAGSIFEQNPADPARCFNTCQVFNPDGDCVARYRKINLFHLEADKTYSERSYQTPGDPQAIVTASSPWGGIGLSICYDLRFPAHYQQQSRQQGATLLAVPSAFLQRTGKDHWEVLLKARAIENQCFVLAPNAVGGEPANYGHSMIIDPWGKTLALLPAGEGFVSARLDFKQLEDVRQKMPVLNNNLAK